MVVMPSMYIATVYPGILSIANGGFVSSVNFRGPGHKPLDKKTNFTSVQLHRNLRKHVSLPSSFT